MLTEKKASEIPQFVVVLAIVVVLGAAAVWGISDQHWHAGFERGHLGEQHRRSGGASLDRYR